MRIRITIACSLALLVSATVAQQVQEKAATKLVASTNTGNTPSRATPVVKAKAPKNAVNADLAYKNNCMRCHGAPRKFPDRAMATIMQHMRVRANLTAAETKAILEYLTE